MNVSIARHMIAAEVLKLRRNRSLMAFSLLLSVGVIVILFGYDQLQHAIDPSRNQSAGGSHGFEHAVRALGLFFGALVSILIGSEAGTADQTTGVFRDLVATGRSRLALFAVRAPAAIGVTLAFTGAAFVVATAMAFAFAGSLPTPSVSVIVESAAWIALANAIQVTLAVGVGSLSGSRALTLTAVIGWQTVATQLLLNASSLGAARGGLLSVALGQLLPIGDGLGVGISDAAAVIVLVAWTAVPLAFGAWRVRTADA